MKILFTLVIALAVVGCAGSGAGTSASVTYSVGRVTRFFTDSARAEKFGGAAGSSRTLAAYIWYPCVRPKSGTAGPFIDEATATQLGPAIGVPASTLMSLPTSSYPGQAAISNQKFPVLIMSHGDTGFTLQYTRTAEDLASKGYVVIGVSHTFNAQFTPASDGTILPGDPAASVQTVEPVLTETSQFPDYDTNWQKSVALDKYYADDLSFLTTRLSTMDASDSILKGILDVNNVGVFGHSFGGSHAFRVLRESSAVKAAASIDGAIYNDDVANGTTKPLLIIQSSREGVSLDAAVAHWQSIGFTPAQIEVQKVRGFTDESAFKNSPASYILNFSRAEHNNFTDVGLWESYGIPAQLVSRTQSPEQILAIESKYLTAFFDRSLKGKATSLLSQPATDPYTTLTRH